MERREHTAANGVQLCRLSDDDEGTEIKIQPTNKIKNVKVAGSRQPSTENVNSRLCLENVAKEN